MKSGFYCLDCAKAERDTLISYEQMLKTGETFGRGLCETCTFMAKPITKDAHVSVSNERPKWKPLHERIVDEMINGIKEERDTK